MLSTNWVDYLPAIIVLIPVLWLGNEYAKGMEKRDEALKKVAKSNLGLAYDLTKEGKMSVKDLLKVYESSLMPTVTIKKAIKVGK